MKGNKMIGSILSFNFQQPVEQQTPGGEMQPDHSLWVTNPRRETVWDSDDFILAGANGDLEPGETFSYDLSMFADWVQAHRITQSVTCSKSASLVMSFEVPEVNFKLDKSVTTVMGSGKLREEQQIVGATYEHNSPLLEPIPDSNGGVAKLVTLRFSVKNTGNRIARSVGMQMEVRLNLGGFPPNMNNTEPRFWWG